MTAVEWLMLEKALVGYIDDEMVEQALIMEKEQILKAYDKGYDDVDVYEPEKYFNETYKK
jgi:hypothetical protein